MSFPIFDFIAQRASLTPGRTAMEDLASGARISYHRLDDRARRAATLLGGLGVGAGDRVAILCRNRVEFFELLFACGKLGAIFVPLNWRMPAAEIRPMLEDSDPKVLFYGEEDAPVAGQLTAPGLANVGLDDSGPDGYEARRDAAAAHPGRGPWEADEVWYLIYTSGTTGKPKGVMQTYGMALANYVNISQAMGLRGEDTTVNFLPLFHTAGINLTTLPALIDGATVLVMPGFDVDRVVELLAARRLSTFFAVPAVYQAISLHADFEKLDLSSVRCWACGGAPLPEALVRTFAPRGAKVLNGMGMTETGPTVFLMDEERAEEKIISVGKPQMLSAVRLVDADGDDVQQGETGELLFAGPGVTPGYWNRPDETRQALPDGIWLHSGDLARQDEDGYYYIVGRLKDMYISGGENVYPAEVENVLADHPDVLESAVIGIPDERWGEVGKAYLLPRPGHRLPSDDALATFCRDRLAAYKVPKEFVAVDEFPRTAAGKIQKHLL